jgi:hypothetical protein
MISAFPLLLIQRRSGLVVAFGLLRQIVPAVALTAATG